MRRRRKKRRSESADDSEILKTINRVVKQGKKDKDEFFDEMDRVQSWVTGNKDEIYKAPNTEEAAIDEDEAEEPRHYPLLWAYVESLTSLIASEITPFYIGKFEQGKEYLGDIGNALFDALRTLMHWDEKVSDIFQQIILFQSCVAGPYVDEFTCWPDKIIGIRLFNQRQFYCTRKKAWSEAPERVLCYEMEKDDLKYLYPDKAKQIEDLPGGTLTEDEGGMGREDSDKITLDGPHLFGSGKSSDNAVSIREAWIRDLSSSRTSQAADDAKIENEHNEILNGVTNGEPVDTSLWLDDWDLHPNHIRQHSDFVNELRTADFGPGSIPDLEAAISQLETHIADHEYVLEKTPLDRLGLQYTYPDGWRYIVVANQKTILADGPNPYLEYGIKGPPLDQAIMCKDALETTGRSWAAQLIDLNAVLSSMMNDSEYMFESRQGAIAYQDDAVDANTITNDGRTPIKVKKGHSLADAIMTLPASQLPPQLLEFIGSLRSFMEESAGLYQAARGGRPPGVRSGQQLQNMISQNETSLSTKSRNLKPFFVRVATWIWQMEVSIGIDLEMLKPVIDEILADAEVQDLDEIERAPFAVGIKVKSGPTTNAEDRRQIIETVIPSIRTDFQGTPELPEILGNLYCECWGEDWPALKRAIKKLVASQKAALAKAQALAEAQARAQAGQANVMAGAAGGGPQGLPAAAGAEAGPQLSIA